MAFSIGASGYSLEHLATPIKGNLLNSVFRTKPKQSSGQAGPTALRAAPQSDGSVLRAAHPLLPVQSVTAKLKQETGFSNAKVGISVAENLCWSFDLSVPCSTSAAEMLESWEIVKREGVALLLFPGTKLILLC